MYELNLILTIGLGIVIAVLLNGAVNAILWSRRIPTPGDAISFWLEDGALVVHNRSQEPIFDVLPFIWDSETKERRVFKYLPPGVDRANEVEGISPEDARVAFYSVNMPPGMWAVDLGATSADPKQLGLAFEGVSGTLFRIQQGRVATHAPSSIDEWFNVDLSHTPELEFTRIREDELGVPFQEQETERSITIMSSTADAAQESSEELTERPVRS